VVHDLDNHGVAGRPRGDCWRSLRRGVAQCVGGEVGQGPFEQARIGGQQRQIIGMSKLSMSPESRFRANNGATSSRAVGRRNGFSAPVCTRLMSRRLPISRSSRSHPLRWWPATRLDPPRSSRRRSDESADRGLNGREWCSEIVTDGRKKGGAHSIAFGQRLGLSSLNPQSLTFQGAGACAAYRREPCGATPRHLRRRSTVDAHRREYRQMNRASWASRRRVPSGR
jgi:hypothetical protein